MIANHEWQGHNLEEQQGMGNSHRDRQHHMQLYEEGTTSCLFLSQAPHTLSLPLPVTLSSCLYILQHRVDTPATQHTHTI